MQKINARLLKFQILLWLPVACYAALIYYLSSLQDLSAILAFDFFDKILHTVEYAIFGLLLMRAFINAGFKFGRKGAFLFSVGVAFLYAISDEIHQNFVPGRSAAISDMLFDLVGAGLGAYFYPKVHSTNDRY